MSLLLFLAVGTALMLAVMLYLRKYYQLALWKIIVSSILLTVSGLAGTKIMFWIESGGWSGTSFYGAIFFTPFIMAAIAILLKIKVAVMLDLCAPSECIMLALMKGRCIIYNCCAGRVLCVSNGEEIRFPSQITEMLVAFILLYILIQCIKKFEFQNSIYAWYMVLYGTSRFVLNLLRDTEPFVWIFPAGNFWSMISVMIGVIWLLLWKKRRGI